MYKMKRDNEMLLCLLFPPVLFSPVLFKQTLIAIQSKIFYNKVHSEYNSGGAINTRINTISAELISGFAIRIVS